MRFKYGGEKYLREFFAEELKPVFLKHVGYADVIVYVPTTNKKVRQRGYNQGEVLAREFSKFSQIPVVDAIQKIKETESQVGLTLKERRENLKGSFKVVDKKAVKDKRVLIIDDVMTTGSTVETIAEKLKSAGAREVIVLTVASVNFKNPTDEKE
jgi:ComF family protein